MIEHKLRKRLNNWGDWLNYDAEIGPAPDKCRSLESRCLAEAGDVFDDERLPTVVPDITDAENMQSLIRTLDCAERWALAIRYGGECSVMKWKRMDEHALCKLADNAEVLLSDMVREAA